MSFFSFASTEKIFEESDWVASLHGVLFNENFKTDPLAFLKKAYHGLTTNLSEFHESLDGTYFLIFYLKGSKKAFPFKQ